MAEHVFKGTWINHSRGWISGTTLTLSEREGGLLTAFIATFVTIVGAELWKILCYISHQLRSKSAPQDGLYHQQQGILRNSPTPGGAAWLFLQQAWFWAGKVRISFLRTLPWALLSVLYIVAIGVAAIFSSEISKSPGPLRLMSSDNCGLWSLNASSPYQQSAFQSKITNDTLTAASYARACYGGNYDPLRCGRYPTSSLDWTLDSNVTCPFPSATCLYQNTAAAVQMKSKMIDSHVDLGINSPESGRIQIEKTTTCAPLRVKPYTTIINVTNTTGFGVPGDQNLVFWLGPLLGNNVSNTSDWTWYYNTHAAVDSIGYTLHPYFAMAGYPDGTGTYVPIPALQSTNADLSLIFIAANSIRYDEPCDDPIFGAHILDTEIAGYTYYLADHYATTLGCSEQYRICNPTNGKCTAPLGSYQLPLAIIANEDGLDLTVRQNMTAVRITTNLAYSSTYHTTFTRSGGALRADETVTELEQQRLPANQWQIEVEAWFDAGLARLQDQIQQLVTNTANIVPGSYLYKYEAVAGNVWWEFCHNQLINDNSGSVSFSVLGMAALFIIGGLIVLVSLTIDTIVGFIQQKTGKGLYSRMEWLVSDKLQMQRMLYSEMKLGQWHGGADKKVPVTFGGQQKFSGPAESELRAESAGRSSEDGAGAQLVQEEHIEADGSKGWRYHA